MKIFSVTDPEFKPYGRVVTGLDTAKAEILAALANTPLPAATDYVAEDAALQELPAAVEVSEHLFGGMPCQLGWCNGHNTYLNCLEYHRDSEFNLGTEDFVLLLARQEEIAGGKSTYQIAQQPVYPAKNKMLNSRRGDLVLLINGMPLMRSTRSPRREFNILFLAG